MIPAQTIKNLKECERRGKHILSKQSELSKSCKGFIGNNHYVEKSMLNNLQTNNHVLIC